MKAQRKSGAETRELILDAVKTLMVEHGPDAVNVASVMRQAGVSRTAFYRQFDSIHGVYAEILLGIQGELLTESGEWVTDPDAVGSPADVRPNLERYARSLAKHIDLLVPLNDAFGSDPRLRKLWRESFIQPFADASEASIIRDQAAGAVSPNLDPASTALMLTFLGEIASLELMGRQHVSPGRYADIVGPFWTNVLFGTVPDDNNP